MPTVNWYLGPGESLANFLTQNSPTSSSGSYKFIGSGGFLGFYNPLGGSIGNPATPGSTAPAFLFQSGSTVVVSVAATVSTYTFYHDHLLVGVQDAIDYLFGTLGSTGNSYEGNDGAQVFEAFRDGDGFIGAGGNDVFQLGRVTSVTDISYIHGNLANGVADTATDTIQFVGAFNGTIHQISNIDSIVFDYAAAVTFALDDTNSSLHNPLGNVLITTNVIGASLTLTQAGAGGTYWYTGGWTFADNQPFALTINTYAGDFVDFVVMDTLSQAPHFGNVHINTYGGNDTIAGLGAHVVIDGGDGIDVLVMSAPFAATGINFDLLDGTPNWAAFGYDSVTGIERVSMSAGGFDDTLSGADYSDLIQGYAGDDSINGRGGDDNLSGQAGNDTIHGGGDQDYIDGGIDNDKLYGDDGNDQIIGSLGNDWIEGGNDNDYVSGGLGSDTMDGGDGTDMLSFNGDETYTPGSHGVIVSLGAGGIDTDGSVYPADLDADAVAALLAIADTTSLTLAAGTALGADGSTDHFSNFEGLEGSQLGDFLIGSDGANTLYGNTGDDWIYGEGGADTVYAGSGAEHVFGGGGADTLYGESEDDTLMGGAGDDTIDGGDGTGDTAVYAGAWTAFSFSGNGTITVNGTVAGEGTDRVSNVEFFTFNGKTVDANHLANEGPVGVDDSASITEASGPSPVTPPATGNVLSNDTDTNSGLGDTKALTGVRAGLKSDGGPLTVVSAQTIVQGTYGALTVNSDGSYSYAIDSNLAATLALKGGAVAHDLFTYRIEDAHGSSDIAQIDVTVREKNDAPAGTNKTITVNEDTSRSFVASDFGFSDSDGNAFTKVIISALPGKGTLKLSGVAVTPNQAITVEQLSQLVWAPAANGNGNAYATIGFKVVDNGGTANSGADTDASANLLTFNVTPVNDAPAGTSKTITVNEDASRSFAASDFGFTDSDGNALAKVIISALPGKGTLKLSGVAVTLNQAITVGQLSQLVWAPAANGNGNAYATIGFKVVDNGGTANGGADTDATANVLTLNVTPVNDAPVITAPNGGAATSIQVNENIKTTSVVTNVHAIDIDGPSVTYSIVSGGDGSRFSINSTTGALTFKAVPDFETPADGNHDNVYTVQLKASDGALSDTQTLTITVKNLAGSVTGTSAGEKIDASHDVGGKFATSEEDKIDGKGGNDTINGGGGNDTITGGSGKDHFVFATALSVAGVDTVTDFSHAQGDKIDLDNAVMAALGSKTGSLGNQFYSHSGATNGHDSDDHIVYDSTSGKLYYDSNGSGAGGLTQIAVISGHPALVVGDFAIV